MNQALKIQTQVQRKALLGKLPHLAQRVFALGGKHYTGFGYHWSLVKSMGYLLHKVSDFDSKYTPEDQASMEVVYEDLLERVRMAEASSALHEDRLAAEIDQVISTGSFLGG